MSKLRYLSIRGNRLRSDGVTSLVQRLASVSEANEGMPLLSRLFLQDNEIDGCTGDVGIFGPVTCMAIMKRYALINQLNLYIYMSSIWMTDGLLVAKLLKKYD